MGIDKKQKNPNINVVLVHDHSDIIFVSIQKRWTCLFLINYFYLGKIINMVNMINYLIIIHTLILVAMIVIVNIFDFTWIYVNTGHGMLVMLFVSK